MGHSKEKAVMKINGSFELINNNSCLYNNENHENFAQWLNSPIKEKSGDEFYWQHQNQLQQSSLRFNAALTNHHPLPTHILSSANLLEKLQTCNQESEPLEVSVNNSDGDAAVHPILSLDNKAISNITQQVNQCLEQIPDARLEVPIKRNDHPRGTTKSTPVTREFKQKFKNHHIFIKDYSIELTLNTHELNQLEQNELKELLTSGLKRKGYVLTRLFINGVTHD